MSDPHETARKALRFVEAAREASSFVQEFGLHEVSSDITILRFASRRVRLDVYHGRMSLEINGEIDLVTAPAHEAGYPISTLVGLLDADAARSYRRVSARTPELVRRGLEQEAGLLRRYGEEALHGDETLFRRLATYCRARQSTYAADIRYSQTLPKAEAAFRERDFERAAELYATIEQSLTPAERHKFLYAKKKS